MITRQHSLDSYPTSVIRVVAVPTSSDHPTESFCSPLPSLAHCYSLQPPLPPSNSRPSPIQLRNDVSAGSPRCEERSRLIQTPHRSAPPRSDSNPIYILVTQPHTSSAPIAHWVRPAWQKKMCIEEENSTPGWWAGIYSRGAVYDSCV